MSMTREQILQQHASASQQNMLPMSELGQTRPRRFVPAAAEVPLKADTPVARQRGG